MSCWALIPIKARSECKSRLAPQLDPQERVRLARWMLNRTLEAAFRAELVSRVLVVSPERDRLPDRVQMFQDSGLDLNRALHDARACALAHGAGEIIVLHADLPELTSAEIDHLIRAGQHNDVALAPDARSFGTNAVYAREPKFEFQFGAGGSYRRHRSEAARLGLTAVRVDRPGLAKDVDTVGDTADYLPGINADPTTLRSSA